MVAISAVVGAAAEVVPAHDIVPLQTGSVGAAVLLVPAGLLILPLVVMAMLVLVVVRPGIKVTPTLQRMLVHGGLGQQAWVLAVQEVGLVPMAPQERSLLVSCLARLELVALLAMQLMAGATLPGLTLVIF